MTRVKPSAGAFAGAVARNRQHLFDVLSKAIDSSGLTQAQIAEWAGISPEHLSRLLRRPRNIEWDTLSRILFAACGGTVVLTLAFPRGVKTQGRGKEETGNYSGRLAAPQQGLQIRQEHPAFFFRQPRARNYDNNHFEVPPVSQRHQQGTDLVQLIQ